MSTLYAACQQLQIFDFNQSPVRVIDQGGQPWFVAKDVCQVLEIANSRDAVADLDEDERGGVGIADAIGRSQNTICISESGLYALIFKSRKAVAKAFRKWVTGEVLPTIRKNGAYSANGDRVQMILEKAIVDVYEGNLSLEKAAAIVSLANQYYRNEKKITLEIPCEEAGDFGALVAALWAKDEIKEWTSREARQVALEEGLFSRWLSRETVDGPSVGSRFGLLCDRFNGNVFEGVRFERHGRNRGRYFILRKESN